MKFPRWLVLVLALAPVWLRADETTPSARIVAVTGGATLSVPGSATQSAAVGAEVPVGTVVTTSNGAHVTLRLFEGTIAIVQPATTLALQAHAVGSGSDAGREITLLDLRVGGVVASIDPAKKNHTDFRVRTPKGVAAAHGTVFSVRVEQNNPGGTLTTMSGTVTFVTDHGEFTVPFGQVASGSGLATVADAVKANPNLAKDIIEATSLVAGAIGNGTLTNSAESPHLVNTVLAAITDVAVQAAPNNAADIVKTVISTAGPGVSGQDNSALQQVVKDSAKNAVANVNPGAASEVAAQIDKSVPTPNTAATNNPILPPLDQTQVIVSPSGQH